jgi:hypothetical protein
MAVFIPQYGNVLVFANQAQITTINNTANRRFGGVWNASVKATDLAMFLRLSLAGNPNSGGAIELWMVSSVDGLAWTDNYPASFTEGASVAQPANSRMIVSIPAFSTAVTWQGALLDYIPSLPPYFGFIISNKTGVTVSSHADNALTGRLIGYEYA